MKNFFKKIIILLILSFCISFIPFSLLAYSNIYGLILLQVEENGEAWYVLPDENKRVFLNRPLDAFNIMKSFGLGIKSSELDYYIENSFPERLLGKILLDVERNGEAYYIYPTNKQAYFLSRPSDAFEIMRSLSLGIRNQDLEKIEIYNLNKEIEKITDNDDLEEVKDVNDYKKENLPENIKTLNDFINHIESSYQLVSYLNKYFILEEREGYITKEKEEFFNDKSGNEFDFISFASSILNEKLSIVGIIRYEYLNDEDLVKSRAIIVYRDEDSVPRQIFFNNNKLNIGDEASSFRGLMRHHESKFNININRWAYFPASSTDLNEPIYPLTWQN